MKSLSILLALVIGQAAVANTVNLTGGSANVKLPKCGGTVTVNESSENVNFKLANLELCSYAGIATSGNDNTSKELDNYKKLSNPKGVSDYDVNIDKFARNGKVTIIVKSNSDKETGMSDRLVVKLSGRQQPAPRRDEPRREQPRREQPRKEPANNGNNRGNSNGASVNTYEISVFNKEFDLGEGEGYCTGYVKKFKRNDDVIVEFRGIQHCTRFDVQTLKGIQVIDQPQVLGTEGNGDRSGEINVSDFFRQAQRAGIELDNSNTIRLRLQSKKFVETHGEKGTAAILVIKVKEAQINNGNPTGGSNTPPSNGGGGS